MITNEQAVVVLEYEYRAFGTELDKNGTDENRFSYIGREFDEEINLYYVNARYYDATLGRFINVDPIQDGYNWYVYCNNNPLKFVDPTGLYDKVKVKEANEILNNTKIGKETSDFIKDNKIKINYVSDKNKDLYGYYDPDENEIFINTNINENMKNSAKLASIIIHETEHAMYFKDNNKQINSQINSNIEMMLKSKDQNYINLVFSFTVNTISDNIFETEYDAFTKQIKADSEIKEYIKKKNGGTLPSYLVNSGPWILSDQVKNKGVKNFLNQSYNIKEKASFVLIKKIEYYIRNIK
jgi:RHS repeat-associated protein